MSFLFVFSSVVAFLHFCAQEVVRYGRETRKRKEGEEKTNKEMERECKRKESSEGSELFLPFFLSPPPASHLCWCSLT